MTWHANASNYKFIAVDKKTGIKTRYLNARDLCIDHNVTHSTLYRILKGYPSRKHDKYLNFIRCCIPIDKVAYQTLDC